MTALRLSAPGATCALICLILLSCLGVNVFAEPTCSVEKHLNDCGYMGITEAECLASDCCWNEHVPPGSPWCFYKNDGYKYFSTTAARVDCGYVGAMFFKCRSFGCYFSPKYGEPWCFYPNTNIDPALCPDARVECGYVGIDQDECESMDCCWSPLKEGSSEPWCFHSLISPQTPEPIETSPDTGPGVGVKTVEPETEEAIGTRAGEAIASIRAEEIASASAPAVGHEGFAEVEPFTFDDVYETFFGATPSEAPVEPGSETPEGTTTSKVVTAPVTAPVVMPFSEAAGSEEAVTRNEAATVLPDETTQALELTMKADAQERNDLREAYLEALQYGAQLCDVEALTEEECLLTTGCSWEMTNNGLACLQRSYQPGSRSLGKFWKPQAIY